MATQSWSDIIKKSKEKKEEKVVKEPAVVEAKSEDAGGFFLDFGIGAPLTSSETVKPEPKANKKGRKTQE